MKKFIYILMLFLSTNLFSQSSESLKKVASISARSITPIGIFSENWNIGGALYASYGWIYSEKWSLIFQTGYNRYRLKSASKYSGAPKLSMFPIQVGGRLYFLNGGIKPFFEAMSGINFIRLFYKEGDTLVDERETHINFQIGGGVAFRLNKNWGIEVATIYNSHLINPSIPYNLTGFEYGIGLNWIFD
ncbi:MAG: hypothetical protein ABFS12_13350 [Bacteroidota bacterium]